MTDRRWAERDRGLCKKGIIDMKQGNVVVTVILVAAVLLAACGLGLLIRQARMGSSPPPPQTPTVVEPDAPAPAETPTSSRRFAQRRSEPTPEQLAAAKQQRADELAEVAGLTEEERQQRRDALRAQLRRQDREPTRVPHLSPEELEEISRKWPQMTEEERQAFRLALSRTRPVPGRRVVSPTEANAPSDAEPNAADGN